MRVLVLVGAMVVPCAAVHGRDVQLFNPGLLGRPTFSEVKLLFDKAADEIEPYMMSTDIKCGVYYAASVFYRKPATLQQVRASLNRLYQGHEIALSDDSAVALWRVKVPMSVYGSNAVQTSDQTQRVSVLGIQLTQENGNIRVIYIEGRLATTKCTDH